MARVSVRRTAVLTLALAACATTPRLIPDGAPPDHNDVQTQQGGVQLLVMANSCRGQEDLNEKYIPLWVQLTNGGPDTFPVTLASFTLIDDSGVTHPALPPALIGMPAGDPSGATPPPYEYGGGRRRRRRMGGCTAITEGTLIPGTQARGFVAFDRVPNAKHLVLHIQAASTSGQPPLDLSVPFTVGEP